MQINQTITVGNHSIQVQGSIEIPLFDAQQVILQALEYKQLEDCWFYKTNKTNPLFISRIEDQNITGVSPVIQNSKKYHINADNIYLTEYGLYECLFSSNKQIAQQFRIQIMTLLSDIRIGNIKLLVERQCETTRIVQESEQTILSYITKNSELEQQLLKLQSRLDQSLEEIHIYEIEINGKFYRGTAIELMRRLKQHMKKSSNPDIRRACSEGVQIKTRLIHSQKVANRHERNYIESEFIKRIPSNARMNKNMPRVRDSSLISEECKQELQNALNGSMFEQSESRYQYEGLNSKDSLEQDTWPQFSREIQIEDYDLTTINEGECIDIEDKIRQIKEFINTNKQYPLQKGETLLERQLASTVQYLRRGRKGTLNRNGKLKGISDKTVQLVDSIIPGFVWANHKSKHDLGQIQLIKQRTPAIRPILAINNYITLSSNEGITQDNVKVSFAQLKEFTVSEQIIQEFTPYGYKTKEELSEVFNLNPLLFVKYILLCNKTIKDKQAYISNLYIDKFDHNLIKWYIHINEVIVFNQLFQRLPTDKHQVDTYNENSLGRFINRCTSDQAKYDQMQNKVLEILKIKKKSTTDDEFKTQLKEFLVLNNRKLKDTQQQDDETKLYKRLNRIKLTKTTEQLKEYLGLDIFNHLVAVKMKGFQ